MRETRQPLEAPPVPPMGLGDEWDDGGEPPWELALALLVGVVLGCLLTSAVWAYFLVDVLLRRALG